MAIMLEIFYLTLSLSRDFALAPALYLVPGLSFAPALALAVAPLFAPAFALTPALALAFSLVPDPAPFPALAPTLSLLLLPQLALALTPALAFALAPGLALTPALALAPALAVAPAPVRSFSSSCLAPALALIFLLLLLNPRARKVGSLDPTIGALIIRRGFRVLGPAIPLLLLLNPQNSVGNYLGPYTTLVMVPLLKGPL